MAKKERMMPQQATVEQSEELVEFETWHASRGPKIPQHHHKEILKADFKARGLCDMATMKDFDEALTKYGVKLA